MEHSNRYEQFLDVAEIIKGDRKSSLDYRTKTESLMHEIESGNYSNILNLYFYIDDLRLSGGINADLAKQKRQELELACKKLTGESLDVLLNCFYPSQPCENKIIEKYTELQPIEAELDERYVVKFKILPGDRVMAWYADEKYQSQLRDEIYIIHNASKENRNFEKVAEAGVELADHWKEIIPLADGRFITMMNYGEALIHSNSPSGWHSEVVSNDIKFQEITPLSPNKFIGLSIDNVVYDVANNGNNWDFIRKYKHSDYGDTYRRLMESRIGQDGDRYLFSYEDYVVTNKDLVYQTEEDFPDGHENVYGIFSDGRFLARNRFMGLCTYEYDPIDSDERMKTTEIYVDDTPFNYRFDFVKILDDETIVVVTFASDVLILKKNHQSLYKWNSKKIYELEGEVLDISSSADGRIYFNYSDHKNNGDKIIVLGDGTK